MIYLTLDTCVWLELLKADLSKEDGVFEEICFWIENGYLKHITTTNLIREWDRNKVKKVFEIISQVTVLNRNLLGPLLSKTVVKTLKHEGVVEEEINKRLNRIENILNNLSETAPESEAIFLAAGQRNLKCLAPNHKGDSYRDTVNILSLIAYLKDKQYPECYFSTINYRDFSADNNKQDLHPHLIQMFEENNLSFVFFNDDPPGGKLVKFVLADKLPKFQSYLATERNKREEQILKDQQLLNPQIIENPDIDFIENIRYIDAVVSKKQPTAFELKMVTDLTERHSSYKEYFLNKVGDNGMV